MMSDRSPQREYADADRDYNSGNAPEIDASNPGNQIYVRGLSFKTTEDELRAIFDRYGVIDEISVVKDPHLNECRGFAFVRFMKNEEAQAAIAGEHDQEFHGRRLIVELSRRTKPRPKTPGEYLGRLSAHDRKGEMDNRRGYGRRDRSRERYDRRDRSRDRGYERRDRSRDGYRGGRDRSREGYRGRDRSRDRGYDRRDDRRGGRDYY